LSSIGSFLGWRLGVVGEEEEEDRCRSAAECSLWLVLVVRVGFGGEQLSTRGEDL